MNSMQRTFMYYDKHALILIRLTFLPLKIDCQCNYHYCTNANMRIMCKILMNRDNNNNAVMIVRGFSQLFISFHSSVADNGCRIEHTHVSTLGRLSYTIANQKYICI